MMLRRCVFFICLALLSACSDSKELKVMASAVPHAEILEAARPDLEAEGIKLKVIVMDDYTIPNHALASKEIDANFFQHIPFLEEQIKEFRYPLEILAKIEIEPMGIYSKKIASLKDIRENAVVAIPNDPTNESRALQLLQAHGLIQLDGKNDALATVLNIKDNPKRLKFLEIDAAMLPRTLDDVDIATINTNYALLNGFSLEKDALALESKDSRYVNVIVIRKDEQGRSDLQVLVKVMTSEKMRTFILTHYKEAILPAF